MLNVLMDSIREILNIYIYIIYMTTISYNEITKFNGGNKRQILCENGLQYNLVWDFRNRDNNIRLIIILIRVPNG